MTSTNAQFAVGMRTLEKNSRRIQTGRQGLGSRIKYVDANMCKAFPWLERAHAGGHPGAADKLALIAREQKRRYNQLL
jgi:hypothetical protein